MPKNWESIHFNSSMVRLKDGEPVRKHNYKVFQFQYGAIEGLDAFNDLNSDTLFQFQYGAIEGADRTLRIIDLK